MHRRLAVALLVTLLIGVTSPAWARTGAAPTNPTSAYPGQRVTLTGGFAPAGEPADGNCDISTTPDRPAPLQPACTYTATNEFEASFTVPSELEPDTSYAVFICGPAGCATQGPTTWSRGFKLRVLQPVVPPLRCLTLTDALAGLEAHGLQAKPQDGLVVVGGSQPAEGTPVAGGTTVVLLTARIPDLTGLTFDEAGRQAAASCATVHTPDSVAGDVVSQDPAPGSPVRESGQPVTVRMPASSAPSSTPPSFLTTSPPSSESTTPASSSRLGGHDDGGDGGGGLPGWVWPQGGLGLVVALIVGAASYVGVRTWRQSRLPEVNPALAKVSVVGVPRLRTDLAEVALGPLSASFIVVRHPLTIHLEEHP